MGKLRIAAADQENLMAVFSDEPLTGRLSLICLPPA